MSYNEYYDVGTYFCGVTIMNLKMNISDKF